MMAPMDLCEGTASTTGDRLDGHLQLRPEEARARIDGAPAVPLAAAALSLLDAGVSRGDGAFETVGVWGGRPFRLTDHLDRLESSLAALALPPPPRELIRADADGLLDAVTTDAALRIYVTATGTRLLTISPLPDRPDPEVLVSQPAPWIRPTGEYSAAGAKSMSYGPNMAASRRAAREGGDDALLVSMPEGHVLEGPTFGIAFAVAGVLHVPDPALGIIDSISRRTVVEVARSQSMEVLVGRWPLTALAEADEVIVSSSLRPATAVRRIDGWTYPGPFPTAARLDAGLQARRRGRPAPGDPAEGVAEGRGRAGEVRPGGRSGLLASDPTQIPKLRSEETS